MKIDELAIVDMKFRIINTLARLRKLRGGGRRCLCSVKVDYIAFWNKMRKKMQISREPKPHKVLRFVRHFLPRMRVGSKMNSRVVVCVQYFPEQIRVHALFIFSCLTRRCVSGRFMKKREKKYTSHARVTAAHTIIRSFPAPAAL